MKSFEALLTLPAALLSIVAAHAQQHEWPNNLPRTLKYYPEDEAHMQRESAAQEQLRWRAPAGVKKMDENDEGEKFFLHYWDFGDTGESNPLGDGAGALRIHPPSRGWAGGNESILLPAIAPHAHDDHTGRVIMPRKLEERDFSCPYDTYSCTSIGEADLCCNTGETCVETSDGVGCCPAGAVCGQNVSDCEEGYTSCPNSPNGGCCIPGSSCEGTGCVIRGTHTVVQTYSTVTQTSGASFTTETESGKTVTVVMPTTDFSVSTQTVTLSPSGGPTTQTVTIVASSTCKGSHFNCPASLGGGCCPSGQSCGTGGECHDPTTTTTETARPPVLPTSQTITIQDFSSSTTQLAGCPTGYYQCSAVYLGGCCRVGRDCHTTSCPPQDTETLVTSGRTVYVTGGNGAAATGGSCANGWFACGADGNGGCCPSGYQCGVQSCKANGQRDTAKMAVDNLAVVHGWAWSFVGIGVAVGVGMIWL